MEQLGMREDPMTAKSSSSVPQLIALGHFPLAAQGIDQAWPHAGTGAGSTWGN
jgi:hypothetical protein